MTALATPNISVQPQIGVPIDAETPLTRFVQGEIERFHAASANAPSAVQNAVFSALLNDFMHQLAAACGSLASLHPDPEGALGNMVTMAVAVMQEQRQALAA